MNRSGLSIPEFCCENRKVRQPRNIPLCSDHQKLAKMNYQVAAIDKIGEQFELLSMDQLKIYESIKSPNLRVHSKREQNAMI